MSQRQVWLSKRFKIPADFPAGVSNSSLINVTRSNVMSRDVISVTSYGLVKIKIIQINHLELF